MDKYFYQIEVRKSWCIRSSGNSSYKKPFWLNLYSETVFKKDSIQSIIYLGFEAMKAILLSKDLSADSCGSFSVHYNDEYKHIVIKWSQYPDGPNDVSFSFEAIIKTDYKKISASSMVKCI